MTKSINKRPGYKDYDNKEIKKDDRKIWRCYHEDIDVDLSDIKDEVTAEQLYHEQKTAELESTTLWNGYE